ncbi:alkaline phosphatase family protein [Geminicoccus flavidas]|uniref:hypothetical protein n=1 Tax=Geminicoccus flavidas TaxID=2506407 RepID=UPI00135B7E21|nr:hypothetical protein [Geminicoccus flavidas]
MIGRPWLFLAALLLASLSLNLPGSLAEAAQPWFWRPPVEFVLAVLLAILCGRRLGAWPARAMGACLAMLILVRIVDRLVWLWFGRELVLATDLELVVPLLEVGSGGWRLVPAAAAMALGASCLLLLSWPLVHGIDAAARLPRLAALPAVALVGLWLAGGPLSGFGLDQLVRQVDRTVQARAAEQRFAEARAADPWRTAAPARLFPGLAGVDVLVVFVESYGRSAFDQPDVAALARPPLERLAAAAGQGGKTLVSGFLHSPTVGGQSWLAHATVASGIPTTGQGGWRVYLQSADADLAHLFRRAGHATVMVQPAIVRPFPEALNLGFDRLLFADGLDYAGPRPGYVTMPDQFTLGRVEELLAGPPEGADAWYGQVALVGSHAPFTPPVPPLLPWDALGDGSAFAGRMPEGPGAVELWADPAALRQAYARTIAGTIEVIASWVALPVPRPRLAIILGDHEPAARVLGADPGHHVPVHVLATSPELVQPFRDIGLVSGAFPDPDHPVMGMEGLRLLLLEGFGGASTLVGDLSLPGTE